MLIDEALNKLRNNGLVANISASRDMITGCIETREIDLFGKLVTVCDAPQYSIFLSQIPYRVSVDDLSFIDEYTIDAVFDSLSDAVEFICNKLNPYV